jgi:hypothetical protein
MTLLDWLSVQMVERETSGHMTADHWQYAFAGRVRDLRRGMQRRRRGFRCFGLCLAWSVDHERQCSHRKC